MKILLIITTYWIAVLQNFTVIHIGDVTMKIKSVIKLGILLSPFLLAIEKLTHWAIENSDYITIVLGAVAVDHILGTIKHIWWTMSWSTKKNIVGLVVKLGLVVACGFLFEGLNHLVDAEAGTMAKYTKEYLTITTRIVVFLYPAGSAFSNSSVISGGTFPPIGWMNKLKKFQQNLNTNEFKEPNNQ